MNRQNIKIARKKEAERKTEMAKFFRTWLVKICEEKTVYDFHFTSDNTIYVKEIDSELGEKETILILDKDDLQDEFFSKSLHYLQYLFETNKEDIRAHYEEKLSQVQEKEEKMSKSIKLLQRCSSEEDMSDLLADSDITEFLTFLLKNKETLKKRAYEMLSPKNKRISNFLTKSLKIVTGVLMISLVACLVCVPFIFSHLPFARMCTVVSGCTLVASWVSAMPLLVAASNYDKDKFEEAFELCSRELEKKLSDSKKLSRRKEFASVLSKRKMFIRENKKDYELEVELDALLAEVSTCNMHSKESRLARAMRFLEIERKIYACEEGVGPKTRASYEKEELKSFLCYIGLGSDIPEDEVTSSLITTCMEVLSTPFYGYEGEIIHLLETMIMHIVNKENPCDYQKVIEEALTRRDRAIKVARLLDERMSLTASEHPLALGQSEDLQEGCTMQIKPLEDKKNI